MDASIAQACGQLVKSLTATDKVVKVATTDPNHYDVFVSYCHADADQATPIVSRLQKLNPELKIFYDIQELKTGEGHFSALSTLPYITQHISQLQSQF